MSLQASYLRLYRYVLNAWIEPGRHAGWRASLLIGCVHSLAVAVGLGVAGSQLGIQTSSVERLFAVWIAGAIVAAATYVSFGRDGENPSDDDLERRHPIWSIILLSSSAAMVAVIVAGMAWLLTLERSRLKQGLGDLGPVKTVEASFDPSPTGDTEVDRLLRMGEEVLRANDEVLRRSDDLIEKTEKHLDEECRRLGADAPPGCPQ